MSDFAEADVDDLKEGVGIGRIQLEFGRELSEEQDLTRNGMPKSAITAKDEPVN